MMDLSLAIASERMVGGYIELGRVPVIYGEQPQ